MIKTITLPLLEFIDFIITFKEFATVSKELGILINSIDPEHSICYVQFPEDSTNEKTIANNLALVWRIKTWKESSDKYYKLKKEQEQDRQKSFEEREIIKILTDLIINKTKLDEEGAKNIAIAILKDKSIDTAKFFGYDGKL